MNYPILRLGPFIFNITCYFGFRPWSREHIEKLHLLRPDLFKALAEATFVLSSLRAEAGCIILGYELDPFYRFNEHTHLRLHWSNNTLIGNNILIGGAPYRDTEENKHRVHTALSELGQSLAGIEAAVESVFPGFSIPWKGDVKGHPLELSCEVKHAPSHHEWLSFLHTFTPLQVDHDA